MRFLLLLLLTLSSVAQARVFSFKEKGLSATLEGSFATTQMAQDAFASNIGSGVTMNDKVSYLQGGKIGFAYNTHPRLNLLFSLEALKPQSIRGASGKNSSGTELYLFSSSGLVLNPMFSFEYSYRQIGNMRYFFGAGAGMAQVTVDNKFEINSDGQSALGVSSYAEKIEGQVLNGFLSLGIEAHFVDTSTFVIQAGHRLFKVYEFKHGSAVTSVAEGSVAKGDVVYNADGSKRQVDFSGPFMSVGFRFYIP